MGPRPLRELLVQERLSRWDRRQLAAALGQHPWLWPTDPELERRARALGCAPPPQVPLGDVLLLSVQAGAVGDGGLARLTRTPGRYGGELVFGMRARDAMQHVFGRVSRDLPQLTRPEALLRREAWGAVVLYGGPGDQALLDGASFSLSFALSAASLLAGMRVPEDIAASAVLLEDGTLGPVEGLRAKLRVLHGNALGVRRVLVPALQLQEARDAAGDGLVPIGVSTLQDALATVFPGLDEVMPDAWRTPEKARASVRALYRLALRPERPLLGWRGVARAAERLGAVLPEEDRSHREMADFARRVALRHHGEPARLLWPSETVQQQTQAIVRFTMLAHVLQSAIESGQDDLEEVLARAREVAPPLQSCERGGLRLWGAIGRGLARLRQYDAAATLLEQVVRAWLDGLLAEESTFALSELLRVQGIRGDEAAVERLEQTVAEVLAEPFLDQTSRAYVELALGRAQLELALARAPTPDEHSLTPILEQLERIGEDRVAVPAHVSFSALRLAARGHDALGNGARAQGLRERLIGEQAAAYGLLAALDAAQTAKGGLEEPLEALEAGPAAHFLPQRVAGQPVSERVAMIVREYPY